ncbi:MAG: thiamine-phosphate kinase [Blastocatellia bacterium]|nr:thiamine-phosphate kinase [Blastocatellia bacterium]MCX7751426.1 thiamine-phosphate kinase [Blastocatellia bacterium]MDW8169139.1 thiamine-phosphate kinase [Acidobacteriota bacterium]MDW8256000.1 thiamine-phosphate kinase [Acidobacteriota bacterium]
MRSELEWIRKIREMARRFAPEVILGIGDDAAILKRSPGKWWLVTTDALVEDVHFRREYTPARLLGHKALAVNLSDIAAMGGRPRFFVLSLTVPEDVEDAYVEEFLSGIMAAADRYAVVLIGGNLAASPRGFSAHVTVIGECAAHRAVRRDGAMPGEAIYVTGWLGLSALGLRLLAAGHRLSDALPEHLRRPILAHLAPEPRLSLGQYLAEEGVARAMIDLSDGLSSDLRRLCEESRVGAVLHAEALPVVAEASAFGVDPLTLALHGGEDYELLFTVREEHMPRLEEVRMRFPDLPLTCIGRTISEAGQVYLERAGQRELLAPRGYDHFSPRCE